MYNAIFGAVCDMLVALSKNKEKLESRGACHSISRWANEYKG